MTLRTALGKAALPVLLLASTTPSAAIAQSVRGVIRDAETGQPVVAALVQLGLTEHYAATREDGSFVLRAPGESGVHSLVVTATGYAKRYEPADLEIDTEVRISLYPDPVPVEGVEVSVLPFRTRMRRRLNSVDTPSYTLEGAVLQESTQRNVWDLVGWRHGFQFEGFSDYGCPIATIYGNRGPVALFVDDRPVTMGMFEERSPQDFAVVEVLAWGGELRAYTQKYIDWMTENEKVAIPFSMIPPFCPPSKPAPGTMRRGRPVGDR